MKKLQFFLVLILLISISPIKAAAKGDPVQAMYDLVLDATEDQNLGQKKRVIDRGYTVGGKALAAEIQNRARALVAESRGHVADCEAKAAAAERRAALAEAKARSAATTAARPIPPKEDPKLKVELEKLKKEATDKDAQIAALTKQLQERDKKIFDAIAAVDEEFKKAERDVK